MSLSYRFIARPFDAVSWKDTNLLTALSSEQTIEVPAYDPAPWPGKTIFLHSDWPNVNMLHRNLSTGENWTETPMSHAGPGRSLSEYRYRVDLSAAPGDEIEFVFNDGAGNWINALPPPDDDDIDGNPLVPRPYQGLTPPYNFRTRLDILFVQDCQIFNYHPPAAVSPARIETRLIESTVAGIPERPVRIRLPRGYDSNPWKRYPVVYFHDGDVVFYWQNIWSWDADRIAWYETLQGRMRETILVTIPNGNNYGSRRENEYLPDGDTLVIYPGRAASYLQFMLDNVLPTLDNNYRTLGDAPNTMTAGSSLGGLVSDYIGFNRNDRFGAVGIFSPAYWAAPNYMNNRQVSRLPLRRFFYMGTDEETAVLAGPETYWQGMLSAWNGYLNLGHEVYRDMIFIGGSGGLHSQPDWSDRLDDFFRWALDPWHEANPLAKELYPPELAIMSGTNQRQDPALGYTVQRGYDHLVQTSTDLVHWVDHPLPAPAEAWETAVYNFDMPDASRTYIRLKSTPYQNRP